MPSTPPLGAPSAPIVGTTPAAHPLDNFRDQLGHQPDADVADLARVSVATVKWYRKTHGIAAFVAKAPSKAGGRAPERAPEREPPRPTFREPPAAAPRGEPGARQPQPPAPPTSTASSPWPMSATPIRRSPFVVSDPTVIVRRARVGMTRMSVLSPTPTVQSTPPQESTPVPKPTPTPPAAPNSDATSLASPLDGFRDLLGTIGDHIVAERAGVDRTTVGAYRRRHGIPAWNGFRTGPRKTGGKENAPKSEAKATPAKAEAKSAPKADAEPAAKARRKTAPKVEAAKEVPAAVVATPPAGRRIVPSKIDRFAHLLGAVSDSEIAARVGLTLSAVAKYRTKRGIPGFVAAARQAATVPDAAPAVKTASKSAAVMEAPADKAPRRPVKKLKVPRKSKLDGFVDLIGKLTDSEVAAKAGVTRERVRQLRRSLGVASAQSGAPVESAATAKVEAAPVAAAPLAAPPATSTVTPAAPAATVAPVVTRAPTPAPVPAKVELKSHHLVFVEAAAGDITRTFAAVGTDLSDALARAHSALQARRDGPWTMTSARLDCEALVGV